MEDCLWDTLFAASQHGRTKQNQVRDQVDFVGGLTHFNNFPELQLFGTRRNQARNQANSMENCIKTRCLPLADMAEPSGTKPGTKLILWEALRISAISKNVTFWNQGGTKPGTK